MDLPRVTWFSNSQLSLPLAVAGGVVLAIASNYDRISGLPFNTLLDRIPQSNAHTPPHQSPTEPPKALDQANRQPISFQILAPPKRSISFEIPKTSDREPSN